MKLVSFVLAAGLLSLPVPAAAQKSRKPAKDSLLLSCIFFNAKDLTPKEERSDGLSEPKLVLSSDTDTTVKAAMDAIVSKVQRDQNGTWEVVYYHQDYWFWISGINKVAVRPNQRVKAGDAIGYNEPGQPIELLVYDFETLVDPRKYLRCEQ